MSNYQYPSSFNANLNQPQQSGGMGYSPQGQTGYPPQTQMGYPPQGQMGYPPQTAMGYPPQGQTGFSPQGQAGYPPAGQMGQPQQGQMGYPAQGFMGNATQGPSGYPPQGQMGYFQPGGSMGYVNSYYTGRPTVFPAPSFNAGADSQMLYKAMKGLGTDEDAIIGILSKRSFKQREEIVRSYKSSYGKDLIKSLQSELSGKFERIVLLSLKGLPGMLASSMFTANEGSGTDEIVLIQCLLPYQNSIIKEAVRAYKLTTGHNLENDVRKDTSGDFEKILVAMMQGDRDESPQVDMNMVKTDTDRVYRAGEGRMGTEEAVFTQIFAQRSFPHIKALSQAYAQQYGKPLITAIKKETSRDYEEVLVSVVKFAEDKNDMLAEWLHRAMHGAGTHDESLMLMVLGRSEIDLEDVKGVYQRKYGKSLASAIEGDTSGSYRKMLISLVGH
ncbi:hypothetical protein Aperf_G00000090373 [Anoplocephala perfoliata]